MTRWPGLCFIILFYSLRAAAIEGVVSHTVFYLPDSAKTKKLIPYVELCWQVNHRSLHYATDANKLIYTHIRTDIVLSNDSGVIKEDHFVQQTTPCHNIDELNAQSIIRLRRYIIKPGFTRMKITLTDLNDSLHHFVATDSFNIISPASAPLYSDLQLLDTILPSAEQTMFYKNEQQQIPSCTNFLGEKKEWLQYYAELYNTTALPRENQPLINRVFISKKDNEGPADGIYIKTDSFFAIQDIRLVYGKIDISALPSGNYYLNAKLETRTHELLASGELFFQRLNPHPKVDTSKKAVAAKAAADSAIENVNVLNLNKTFVGKYTVPEIRAILKMLLPVTDASGAKTINGFLKKPDEIYMRYYIYNYFSSIDKKNPGNAWKEYTVRVKEVNKRFTSRGVPGYETDRGFIFLRYGQPSDIITVENEQGTKPYEIWTYDMLKERSGKEITSAVFLFYRQDQISSGDFKLLHSTVSGEMQNMSWRSYLYVNGGGGTDLNSRAEQYIGNR